MGNLNMFKERPPPPPPAFLTKGSYAASQCHTRWRGLESHQLGSGLAPVIQKGLHLLQHGCRCLCHRRMGKFTYVHAHIRDYVSSNGETSVDNFSLETIYIRF